ncbi:ARID DNA-binding domain-containing protein [Tanacetum coccineum]|uniref:ARID DNA-binding domain-containing protein n=1 Tax=Tanacetum coccineum TaxID=301880 RepID=A0ABQ4WX15_9ASTR
MGPTKSLFKRLKNSFKVKGTQQERKIIFSHGIGEAMVEISENKKVIPCVLYTLEITLNVLSLDQLMALGFLVTYGHNKGQISYMFEEDKEGCDGESDCATSKEGNGCDVETKKAMVETSEKKIVIPYVLYTPEITLNALSLDQLMAQGFVVTYGHNKCQISYMFEQDKEGCDVETESMIAKHNKNIVQDYLDEDYISVKGTLYTIKVNSFERFISFLHLIKNDSIVFKNLEVLRKRFEDMIKWFYLIYLKQDVLEPLPPVIGNVKIDLLGLYKMVDSMGGYLSVSFGNRWKEVAVIHGLTEAHEEDLKACYKRTIDMVKFCYDTTLRPWFKEEPVKCEKTKKVEGGCDHAKEENPQEHDGSSKNGLGVVRENTREYFENVQRSETRFGVILEGNNDTDVDQMADQEDGANTSETDDFVVIT